MRTGHFVGWIRRVGQNLVGALPNRGKRSDRQRRREMVQLVRNSSLFDERWYLQSYLDVAAAEVDAASHFVDTGWLEGRDPGPNFATSAYLRANPDVARAGINPLIHYVEFGKFEGREVPGSGKRDRPAFVPTLACAAPAPVFKGEISDLGTIPWRRSYRLPQVDERLVEVEKLSIGLASCRSLRERIDADFAQLRQLSGLVPGVERDRCLNHVEQREFRLLDAWHAGGGLLRTRWHAPAHPMIVRAYQHEAVDDGRLCLVAETLAESPLDIVNVHLNDPYFPILFVFADVQNMVRSTTLIAFPSLCRGGLHYAELVVSAVQKSGAWPDPVQAGFDRVSMLDRIKRDDSGRIRHIAVETADSACSGPLFQPDFQRWLQQVAGVSLGPLESEGSAAAGMLPACPSAGQIRLRRRGGTLILGDDMVPTIGILTAAAPEPEGEAGTAVFAPLLVAAPDPSQPALVVEIPAHSPSWISTAAPGYPPAWPRTTAPAQVPDDNQPAAIRFTDGRELSDTELLVPTMAPPAASPQSGQWDIGWVICPADWRREDLVEALTALSIHPIAGKSSIALAGATPGDLVALAMRLFGKRVRRFDDLSAAVSAPKVAFVGYLGPSVILHDPQAVNHLVGLLQDPSVSSVSCVLLTAEKKGKVVHVTVADAGTIPQAGGAGERIDPNQLAHHLWRSGYPTLRPPRDLWIARADEARTWFGEHRKLREDGIHLCTTMVSASYTRQRSASSADASPPPARKENSVRARSFFG